MLAINKIFDDLFPEEEEDEQPENGRDAFQESGAAAERKPKRPRMPRAAVLLNQTQEFTTVTSSAVQEALPEEQTTYWLEELYEEEEARKKPRTEPDPRIRVIERGEFFDSPEEETPPNAEPEPEPEPQRNFLDGPEDPDRIPAPAEESRTEAEPIRPSWGESPAAEPSERPPEKPKAVPVMPDREALFRELPEIETPVIRKPELRRTQEEESSVNRVLNVPRLIVFLIVAIPSTLAVLAVLAILAALFLGLSLAAIMLGSVLVISAFSGFAVLADILLLLGAALIALALGLLLLWTAFWLIGEVMVAWVRSVLGVQREWCYEEVPAE